LVAFVDDLTAIVKERNQLRDRVAELEAEVAAFNRSLGGRGRETKWTGPKRLNRRKLEERDISDIRYYSRNGLKVTEIARMYDVHHGTISRIISGVYHKDAA
jgi:DNA invertase Pin-like site-specific DNA recombinase